MKKSANHSRLKAGKRALLISAALLVMGLMLAVLPVLRRTRAADNAASRATPPPPHSGKALAHLLNTDGTLNLAAGISGSFDATGYRMELGARGEPRFVPAATPQAVCSDNWASGFTIQAASDTVTAIAVDGSNNVYIGGLFTAVDSLIVNHLAKWDGSSWSALGSDTQNGVNDNVSALAVMGTDLYVGGDFTTASSSAQAGISARHIAKWSTTGNSWTPLGSTTQNGANSPVSALAVLGTDLYVGGIFNTVSSSTQLNLNVNSIARWDTTGNTWARLGSTTQNGANDQVLALAVLGTDLYVGGKFFTVNSSTQFAFSVGHIARWDTTSSTWARFGTTPTQNGTSSTVYALAVIGTDLYVGGNLFTVSSTTQNAISARFIARWDTTGNIWSPLGSAAQNGAGGQVFALAKLGTDLYVGGQFFTVSSSTQANISANHLARWNTTGNTWAALGSPSQNGVNSVLDSVRALAFIGTDLYAGGAFNTASSSTQTLIAANHIAKWSTTGNLWTALGSPTQNGVNDQILAVAVMGTDIYVAGDFIAAGPVFANRIAKWDGSNWSALGSPSQNGVDNRVFALAVLGTDLYVGGVFGTVSSSTQASIAAIGVARWSTTTSTWSPLGSPTQNGVDSFVDALAVMGTDLYVAGGFFTASDSTQTIFVNNIAKWSTTTSTWSPLGDESQNGVDGFINALAVMGTDLYVGGLFNTVNDSTEAGISANSIAKWSTTSNTWSPLGDESQNGVDNNVNVLAVIGTDLYVGGGFINANDSTQTDISANNIARWSTTSNTWSPLGSPAQNGLLSFANAFAVVGTDLYVGGQFTTASSSTQLNIPVNRIAKWNGSVWSDFEGGVDGIVNAVAVSGNSLYVGGAFSLAGCRVSTRFARYALAPTAIELAAFKATGYDGGTFLQWQTGAEVNNLGFSLYREQAGHRSLVNPEIIAGSAFKVGAGVALKAGEAYAWWDGGDAETRGRADAGNVAYYLEDHDLNGGSKLYGPFNVQVVGGKPPAQSRAETLSHLVGGKLLITQPLMTAQPGKGLGAVSPAQFDAASKPAVKLTIKDEGWYRVTQPELVAAGFDPRGNPRNLQLLVDGVEQPLLVTGESDGAFDAADAIEFYGVGQNTLSSDAHIYWLVSGNQPGKRLSVAKTTGKPGGGKSFLYTLERRERTIYFPGLLNGEAENFFGSVITAQPVEQPLTLQHVEANSSASAELEIALQGVTDLPGNTGHIVSVALNGVIIGRVVFDGRAHAVERFSIYQANLREGENQITLMSEGGASDISLVDYIRVSYGHSYTADGDALRLTASASNGATQTIDGFRSPLVRVFDITDANAITELAGQIAGLGIGKNQSYAVTVAVNGQNRTLLAVTEAQIKRPVAIRLNQVSNLRNPGQGADLLIVSQRGYFAALAPLVALRQSQKLSVAVVDIEDIYDEFNYGEPSPQAVKDFLAYTQASWKKKPHYVLLAGDASLDPKNYLGFGDRNVVPTKLIDTQLMETASDDWLADFNDDGVAELAVGRLPVGNVTEATSMVAKLIGYERARAAESVMLVADSNDGFNFEATVQQLRSLIPANLRVEQINRGRMDAATAKAQLLEAIARGEKIINYSGHGSVNQWRGNLLTNEDAARMTNADRLPLFVMMTCLNGYFQDAALDSLGEALMKAEAGGAVAVWASSGSTLPDGQAALNQQMYRLMFAGSGNQLIGEVTRQAKQSITNSDIRRTWILLGDPTMKLK